MTQLDQLAQTFATLATVLEQAAKQQPYGPVYRPEDQKAAGDACVTLCGGDQDQARTLWKIIVTDLGGYMPHAAVVALIRAANTTNLVPDVEPPEL